MDSDLLVTNYSIIIMKKYYWKVIRNGLGLTRNASKTIKPNWKSKE
jgi:hypothetical protein